MRFALPVAAIVACSALPDIVPPNMKGIRVEIRVDPAAFGPLAGRACLQHVIAEGETLESIANGKLGDAGRWQEIEALNPGVEPRRLPVGKPLWLPPRQKAKEGEEPVLLFAGSDVPGLQVQPLAATGNVSLLPRWGQLTVLVVPLSLRERVEAALAARRDARRQLEDLVKAGKIHQLSAPAPDRLVERESPVARCLATYRIVADGDQKPKLEQVSVEQFDANDKPVPPKNPGKIDGQGKGDDKGRQPDKGMLLLTMLGLLGGGGLWVRSRARTGARTA